MKRTVLFGATALVAVIGVAVAVCTPESVTSAEEFEPAFAEAECGEIWNYIWDNPGPGTTPVHKTSEQSGPEWDLSGYCESCQAPDEGAGTYEDHKDGQGHPLHPTCGA